MAVVFAIYGFIDLVLLLAATLINDRVRPMFHAVGIDENRKRMSHKENANGRMCQLEESTMRFTKIGARGQVTIPAELREQFGLRKGTRVDWKKNGSRMVLAPVTQALNKSQGTSGYTSPCAETSDEAAGFRERGRPRHT